MAQMAAVIFSGEVIAVRRHGAADSSTGTVEIEFAVQDAVRGVTGSVYTLREWAGLWPAGDEPFRVGQRYLMLLHSPGAAGLSSPVGGMDGAIPIRGPIHAAASPSLPSRHSLGPAGNIAALASDTESAAVVDLSWVGTRVIAPIAYAPAGPVARPIAAHGDLARTSSAEAGVIPQPGVVASQQSAAYPAVLAILRGWEASGHASH